jgi:2-deoxy-D-gluconate 3-dehydrogenase
MSVQHLIDLTGKRAVVTGAGAGIGAAIATHLAQAGAIVLVTDLDAVAAEATASSLQGLGAAASAMRCDVTSTDDLVAAAEAGAGDEGLDIWVNNAGIYPTTGPALEATDEFIDHMMEVNVRGSFAGAREAARRMQRGGVIVNLASTAGFRPAAGISAYVTSKHAVIGLTKNLALELAPRDIRVVAVAPGVIDTPGVQAQLAPLKAAGLDVASRMTRTPLGRAGHPDDVARVITVLASDLAAWVTGVTVPVDAGSLVS